MKLWNKKPKIPQAVPIYCKTCGKKLEPDDTISRYDEQTGEPIRPFLTEMRCPDAGCRFARYMGDYNDAW